MNKNPVYLLTVIIVLIIGAVWYRYQDYVVNENFILSVSTTCDTTTNNCFVADCSIDEDPECDQTPYSKIEILKRDAPSCLEEHVCENFSCTGINTCKETFCSDQNLEEGERCLEKSIKDLEQNKIPIKKNE
jgi:hypothetical protein